jgi:glycosyltransferase involved in cell wall biosynthesis
MPHISSVGFFCPAYNEATNLPVLIPKVHAFLKSISPVFEILIIENGSKDGTVEVADNLARQYPEVRVIHYPKGLGYGGAVREGFLNVKYDYVCYTDADNQYDIEELRGGFRLMSEADVASGYVRTKAVSTMRKLQSEFFNWLILVLFYLWIRDINCSMKVYKREVLDAIEIKSISAFIDAEMLIRVKRAGFSIKQFPVTHYARTAGVAIGSKPSVILDTVKDMFKFRLGLL